MKIAVTVVYVAMILSGIILIPNAFAENAESLAEMWINGYINDDEFLTSIEYLIETKNITKTSQLPDWLVNNAGWWAARIFTNSDFDFDPGYVKEIIYPCYKIEGDKELKWYQDNPSILLSDDCFDHTNNSYGFRGDEFEKEKSDDTYRIFAVGASTTYGRGASDSETWPVYLQQIINEQITDKEIEVINAGVPGATSKSEYNLIKNKVSSFDPDLIIIYDGWNDSRPDNLLTVEDTIRNWESVCKLGKNEGFDTIIIVQPLPITGHRVLTEQEIFHSSPHLKYLQNSQQYVDAFKELDKVCSKTTDFGRIFDYVQEPIWYDHGHTMSFANKVIAENVFSVISPIYFGKTYSVTYTNLNSEPGTGVIYAVGSDLSNRNFDNLNLKNAVFDKADLSNSSFKNANIDGARFVFANLSYVDLSGRDLTGMTLAGADLSNTNLTNTTLEGANLIHSNLSNVDLSGVNIDSTILIGAKLVGADLSGKDLTGILLRGADLSNANLDGVDLSGMDLRWIKLRGVDLSGKDLTGTLLEGSDLSNANLAGVDLSGRDLGEMILRGIDRPGEDLIGTILKGVDLFGKYLTGVILALADLFNPTPTGEGVDISGKDITARNFTGTILTGADLSNANLAGVDLSGKDLRGTILRGADLRYADLRNADLSGADLTNANLEFADLHEVTLYDTILECINHQICKND